MDVSGTLRISYERNTLVVDGPADLLFSWGNRVFFVTAAGFRIDEKNERYIFYNEANLHEVLVETIEFLREENISCEIDEPIARLLKKFDAEGDIIEEARKAGLESKNSSTVPEYELTLVRKLKNYQLRGLHHLLSVKNGANFSVPGSGKTTVIYAAFDYLRNQNVVDQLLVIGPRSSFYPWEDESEACFGMPLKSARLTGLPPDRKKIYFDSSGYELFLCTYQTAERDRDEIIDLCRRSRFFVVIDESHNVKKLEGGVWADTVLAIAPYATVRAILSGTPIPNDYTDLWTQITFLWPRKQVLGDSSFYKSRCADEAEIELIRREVQPFFFRVKKKDLGLPPQKFNLTECDLNPHQAKIYRALSIKFLREIELEPSGFHELRKWRRAKVVRLMQAASNPTLLARYSNEFDVPPISGESVPLTELIREYPRYERPSKMERAVQLVLESFERTEKIIVWTFFVHNIEMLKVWFEKDYGIETFVVYGLVPRDESEDIEFNREQQIVGFKKSTGPSVLLANPAACAESISLHKACRHAVYLDRTFNCGQYMQSLDRIHRIGLGPNESATYDVLLAKNTIDETIQRRLDEKQANMMRLLEEELPRGTFEVEEKHMAQTDKEEAIDFEETVQDIRKQLEGPVEYGDQTI